MTAIDAQKPKIDLSQVPKMMVPKFKQLLRDIYERFVIVWGGAGAGKSYSVAQTIVYRCLLESGHKWLVCRKVKTTLRHSVVALILHILDEWNMEGLYVYNKSDFEIRFYNGSSITFVGLDDVGKLKSIHGITGIWFEEADEGVPADIKQLNLRLRGKSPIKKRFYMTFNPIWVMHWLKATFFDTPQKNVKLIHATYRDNQFIDDEYKSELESIDDPYYASVYRDGEWGVLGNVVFTNVVITDFDYTENDLENVCQGLDFGFAHAQALERIGFKDGDKYSFDELWAKGMKNDEFIEAATNHFGDTLSGKLITADSASPAYIKEWNEKGYMVQGAIKGKDSLKYGVDFLARCTWYIHKTKCPNLAKEVQSFKRKEDKYGNTLDSFVEINDDGIAASRYATEWIWGKYHGQVEESFSAADLGL